MQGKVVIAGIGETAFGRLPGRTTLSMHVEAVRLALADAGVEKDAVDAVLVKYPTSAFESMYGQKVAEALGIQPRIGGVWDQAGAANIGMIGFAAMAIDAGQCEIAVVSFADNPKSGTRASYQRPRGNDGVFGWYGTAPGYAMIARCHMERFGTTQKQLGAVAVAHRKHGAANPAAQLRKPLSIEDYLSVPPFVEPFTRNDCALISDGGAAIVMMSSSRASRMGIRAPVPILGFGQGQTSFDLAQRSDLTTTMATVSGATAFAMAGLTPKDIAVAQLYDCFSIVPIMTLEDYGFCKKGQGGSYVGDGAIEYGSRLPTNTAGGLLSQTGMPGMQLVIEGVRQMRGEANLQVAGSGACIVSNQGGTMHTHSTLIIGR